MSKRHKKAKLQVSDEYGDYIPEFDGDMYEAPKGKRPRGKQKRKAAKHKTAYYD